MTKNQFGLKPKGMTFSYKRPYLEWYDLVALPTNYRLPEFTKFTSQDGTSTIEHVSRYLTQLDKASVEDAHQVHFFSLSLSGPGEETNLVSLFNGCFAQLCKIPTDMFYCAYAILASELSKLWKPVICRKSNQIIPFWIWTFV